MNSIVRFLKNKNTVTVIAVLIGMIVLCGGYYITVQKQVKPVSVPVAAVAIQPRTAITADMITYIEVPEAYISDNVVKNEGEILGKYSSYNTMIPAGSMFYEETLAEPESMPNYLLSLLKEGEHGVTYNMTTSEIDAPANTIMPGEKIDLYMYTKTEEGSIMLGKFLENIPVLAVLDDNGQSVFEVNDGSRTAKYLYFGVSEDLFLLLRRSQFVDVNFFPVQHGTWVNDKDAAMTLTTQELTDYINAHVVALSSDPAIKEYK